MAWLLIPNNRVWEYDTAPEDPGANSPHRPLWLKQTSGVRTNSDGTLIYTKVRKLGSTVDTAGEINGSFWNVKGEDLKFQMVVTIAQADTIFTIPCQDDGDFDAIIDWGDGTTTTTDTYNGGGLIHTYDDVGVYTIKISGSFPNIYFNNTGVDKDRVTKVLNLGHVGWKNLAGAFYGCSNMTEFSAGASNTSEVTDMENALYNCLLLPTAEVRVDTSSTTRMEGMFFGCAFTDVTGLDNFNLVSIVDQRPGATNFAAFLSNGAKMSTPEYDAMLIAWAAQAPTQGAGAAKFGASQFTPGGEAESAKALLSDTYGWVITDGGAAT